MWSSEKSLCWSRSISNLCLWGSTRLYRTLLNNKYRKLKVISLFKCGFVNQQWCEISKELNRQNTTTRYILFISINKFKKIRSIKKLQFITQTIKVNDPSIRN